MSEISSVSIFGSKKRPCFFSVGPSDSNDWRACVIDPKHMIERADTATSMWLFPGTGAHTGRLLPLATGVDISTTARPERRQLDIKDTATGKDPSVMIIKTHVPGDPDNVNLVFAVDYKPIEQSTISGKSQFPDHTHYKASTILISKEFSREALENVFCGNPPDQEN